MQTEEVQRPPTSHPLHPHRLVCARQVLFKTDDTPIYSTALLLYPSKRLKYLRQNWRADWHEGAIDNARQIWSQYKDYAVETIPTVAPEMEMTVYDKLARSLDVTETDNEDADEAASARASARKETREAP